MKSFDEAVKEYENYKKTCYATASYDAVYETYKFIEEGRRVRFSDEKRDVEYFENYNIDKILDCIRVLEEEYDEYPRTVPLAWVRYEIVKKIGDRKDEFKRYLTFDDFCRWKRYKYLYDTETDDIYKMFNESIKGYLANLKIICSCINRGVMDWKTHEVYPQFKVSLSPPCNLLNKNDESRFYKFIQRLRRACLNQPETDEIAREAQG